MVTEELRKRLDRIKELNKKNKDQRDAKPNLCVAEGQSRIMFEKSEDVDNSVSNQPNVELLNEGRESGFLEIDKLSTIAACNREQKFSFLETKRRIDFEIEKTLFFDIETTSLSQGAGNLPFLVGFAYLEKNHEAFTHANTSDGYTDGQNKTDRGVTQPTSEVYSKYVAARRQGSNEGMRNYVRLFRTKQFFLLDYPYENEMVKSIHSFMEGFDYFVSFNGKAFDLPLINGRFLLNGLSELHREHWDLLYTGRRVWKGYLDSFGLQSIERNILDINRVDDLPSYAIPQRYFDYLNSQNVKIIEPIITHNRIDIESMVILANLFTRIYCNPAAFHNINYYYLGKLFYCWEEFGKARSSLESVNIENKNERIRYEIERMLKKLVTYT